MPTLLSSFDLGGETLLEMITIAGLTTNLTLCLDAGDLASYNGTSQTWTDVSGNNQNFFRGSTSAAQAIDPTFHGIAGNKSEEEYFSLDGGDYFQEASALTFAESWHKNSANFTFLVVSYVNESDIADGFAYCYFHNVAISSSDEPGVSFLYTGNAIDCGVNFEVWNELSGVAALHSDFSPNHTREAGGKWRCFIMSMDEAAGIMISKYLSTGATSASGKIYSSPSSDPSSAPYLLGESGMFGNDIPFPNGSRFAMFAAWSESLTAAQLDTLYAAIKQRFPTLG